MHRTSWLSGIVMGIFSGIVVISLTYVVNILAGLFFIPFDIFDFMARVLPGAIVNFGIDLIVSIITFLKIGNLSASAKLAEKTIAVIQFLAGGAVFGLILAWAGRRRTPRNLPKYGFVGGIVLLLLVVLVELYNGFPKVQLTANIVWLVVVLLGWGAALGWLIRSVTPGDETAPDGSTERRRFLYFSGTAIVAVLSGAVGLGFLLRRKQQTPAGVRPVSLFAPSGTSGPAASPPESELTDRIMPAPGTRPEITSNKDFYRIDIDTRPPEIDAEEWRLEITGLVKKPLSLTLDEIKSRPAISQYITQECISNPIDGSLISTAMYTGVPLKDILDEAGLLPQVKQVFIKSYDDFYESVAMSDIKDERTLLVYEMNRQPLPPAHGFPLRIYIPNRYGMKQPKWIKSIEAIDHEGPGYWVDRGWSREAFVHTNSVIDNISAGAKGSRTVLGGGIAWAGARGISKVEVQVDDGNWKEAELRTPPLSPLTWVQWRYEWSGDSGKHTARVRAYDGDGKLQTSATHGSFPDGATGINTFEFMT